MHFVDLLLLRLQSKVLQFPRILLITIVYAVVVFLTLFCIYLNLIFGT